MKTKNIVIVLLLMFLNGKSFSQNLYKIQFEGVTDGNCTRYPYKLYLSTVSSDPSNLPANSHLILSKTNDLSNGVAIDLDYVLNTNIEYTRFRKISNTSINYSCPSDYGTSPHLQFDLTGCNLGTFTVPWYWGINFSYMVAFKIEPLTSSNSDGPSNELNTCEDLNISAGAQCAFRYAVDYQIGTNGWNSLLAYNQRNPSFTINFSDFPSLQVNDNLFLRVRYNNTIPYSYSNPIIINTVKCSPKVISVSAQPTECSNSSNGSFTVTFDRPLDLIDGEVLPIVNLYNDGPDNILNNGNDVLFDGLFNQTYAGTTYTWPTPLPVDQYRLEYQSGQSNTLEEYLPIVISSPSPVTFTTTWTNVDCFGENTGSISIIAGGGQGNYQFSLNNGADWFPFSNVTTHTISNLPATNYQVKVKDSNECIAQQ